MFGYIAYRAADAPPYVVLDGVRFRAVSVAAGTSLRARLSARAAARALRRNGVRCAVFPPKYPHRALFARYGVSAPPLAPLYRATAAAVARRYLAQRGIKTRNATVALAAEAVTPELRRCAFDLCADVRYLLLAAPRGGEALSRELRLTRGVAARVGAGEGADLVVSFDDTPAVGAALRLDDALGVVYDSAYPNELLAALWRAGALDAAALRVKSVC